MTWPATCSSSRLVTEGRRAGDSRRRLLLQFGHLSQHESRAVSSDVSRRDDRHPHLRVHSRGAMMERIKRPKAGCRSVCSARHPCRRHRRRIQRRGSRRRGSGARDPGAGDPAQGSRCRGSRRKGSRRRGSRRRGSQAQGIQVQGIQAQGIQVQGVSVHGHDLLSTDFKGATSARWRFAARRRA